MPDEQSKSEFTVEKWDALFGQRKGGKQVHHPDNESLNTGYVKSMEKRLPVEGTQDDLTLAAIKLYIIELHQHCLMRMVELEQLVFKLQQSIEAKVLETITANLPSIKAELNVTQDLVQQMHEFLLQVPGYNQVIDDAESSNSETIETQL